MRPAPPSRASRGPIRSSTGGPSGCDHMRPAPPSTAFRGPGTSSTEGPCGCDHMRLPRPFWHISRACRGLPRGSSTEGLGGRVCMRPPAHVCLPLPRPVAL
eukprot:8362274-Pyramimonas_sp.AAC.1